MESKTNGSDNPAPFAIGTGGGGGGGKGGGKKGKQQPKRQRRKCSHPQCDNRVVQGGVCVTHGARRKSCAHPTCSKAVKVAGYCSTHGPSRRKCDDPGCSRVAVQGGKCLSHGARRKICNYPTTSGRGPCGKNAIVGGYCKKHHDRMADARGMLDAVGLCVPCDTHPPTWGGGGGSSQSGEEGGYVDDQNLFEEQGGLGEEYAAVRTGSYSVGRGSVSYPAAAVAPIDVSSATGVAPVLISLATSDYYAYQKEALRNHRDHADAVNQAASLGYGQQQDYYPNQDGRYHPQMLFPPPAKRARQHPHPGHHGQGGHNRGLSIFEEMSTVDAIISSGQQRPQPDVAAAAAAAPVGGSNSGMYYPQAPRPSSRIVSASSTAAVAASLLMSTKTPMTQVSFADSCFPPASRATTHNHRGAPPRVYSSAATAASTTAGLTPKVGEDSPPCTGLMSCSCNACRSPTLAIFDQMIQASHKLERGECIEKEEEVDEKYAGLSPPHLSPRKAGGNNDQHNNEEKLGENISEGTTVVRQVSSNNIAGKIPIEGGFLPPKIHQPQEQQALGVLIPSPRWSTEETSTPEDGVEMELVSMAISEDVSDGGGGRGRVGGGGGGHSLAALLSSSRPSPTRAYDSNPEGQPLTPRLGEEGDDNYPRGGGSYPRNVSSGSPAVVSSHSTNGGAAFLPRQRESIEHLFIPKEV